MLTTLIFACVEFGACTSTPTPPPPPAPVTAPAPAPAPAPTEAAPLTFVVNFDTGWVTYQDGAVLCVNGAPCQAEAGYDPARYTYNWETGIAYGGN